MYNNTKINVLVATIPERIGGLKKVVNSILPQVDMLQVYLNGHKEIPDFLYHNKIKVIRSTDTREGDMGDTGKFYRVDLLEGYILTIDDDLEYDKNYVNIMIEAIERYKRKCVISLHGRVLKERPIENYYKDFERYYRCLDGTNEDAQVHIVGTGVTAYHSDTLKIDHNKFRTGYCADIWFSIQCQQQNVPCIVIKNNGKLVENIKEVCYIKNIYEKHCKNNFLAELINANK